LIETCIATGFISLLFFVLLQVSQIFAAHEVLHRAATSGARAKTVGFNHWMVTKVIRVAAIPNAGPMTQPAYENNNTKLRDLVLNGSPGQVWDYALTNAATNAQYAIEQPLIPDYLNSWNSPRSDYILDYEDWDTIHFTVSGTVLPDGTATPIQLQVYQDLPLWVPGHRAFYGADSIQLAAKSEIENHYALYLDDMDW